METILNSLLNWRYVGQDREYEKYFRYACFSLKWRKITKQPEKVGYYIDSFIEASKRGQDVAVSIINLLQIADSELQIELLEAIKPISERSLKGLNTKEIASAKKIATEIWQQSVVEESIIDQSL
jgi:hypothetical protein